MSNQLIGSSNEKSWNSGPTVTLYVSITHEAMEDNLCYIVDWWSWRFKSRTGTRGTAVRDLLFNCEIPTRLRRCALLNSSKIERKNCPVFRAVFSFQLYWPMMNLYLKILTKSPTTYKIYSYNENFHIQENNKYFSKIR